MNDQPICWRVRFYWKGPHGNTWESSCDGGFPIGTTAMQAIVEVAKWRGVDLDRVFCIEAKLLDG